MSASRPKAKAKSADDVEFLLKTVDEQNEQISRLQSKFRDVTHAYKSLLEEKKALEITVKAMKTTKQGSFLNAKLLDVANRSKHGSRSDLSNNLQTSSRTPSVSDLSEIESQSNCDSLNDLDSSNPKIISNLNDLNQEERIGALTSNIQVLIDAKAKLERGFQAERKQLRGASDELKAKLGNVRADCEEQLKQRDGRIKELRISLKQSQAEREKLTNDLNLMVKSKSADQENKILSMQEENQSILLSLRNENNSLKQKFKNIVKQFENKCEEVAQCEQDTRVLKQTHAEQTRDKEDMLADMRERLSHSQNSSELRIGNLESKINELCSIISTHETKDGSMNGEQMAAELLKSNKQDSELRSDLKCKLNQFEPPVDFDAGIEQMQNLKNYLETTAKELNINFNFNEIWFQSSVNLQQEQQQNKKLSDQIAKLKEENRHLKEEYEKYKIRTNYLIKSAKQASSQQKEASASSPNQQDTDHQYKHIIQKYKDEVDILNKRIHLANKEKQEELKSLNEQFEQQELSLRSEFKVLMEKAEHERLKSIADLEKELVKQRERTVKLLDEREEELGTLKGIYYPISPQTNKLTRSTSENASLEKKSEIDLQEAQNRSLTSSLEPQQENELLTTAARQSNEYLNNENQRIIHYSQENAYKETELNKLRTLKAELEYRMKQINDEHSVDIERFQQQIGLFKKEIERMKLNEERGGMNNENMEYVKNVVFNFMTTKDENVKQSMQLASAQILKFTKCEPQKIYLSSVY